MSAISEHVHVIPSIEVYPRVYYFNKRYNDLLGKYNKFTDKYQKVLHQDSQQDKLGAERNIFPNGLVVKVIGENDLGPEDYLAVKPDLYRVETSTDASTDYIVAVDPFSRSAKSPSSPSKRSFKTFDDDVTAGVSQLTIGHSSSPKTTIDIYYADIQEFNDDGVKKVQLLAKHLSNTKDIQLHDRVLFCRYKKEYSKSEEDAFLKKLSPDVRSIFTRVVIDEKIGEEISQLLENHFAQCFVKLQSVLKKYIKSQSGRCQRKPLTEDVVMSQLNDFLRSDLGSSELIETDSKDEEHSKTMFRKLSCTLRCALVQPLSDKYNVPVGLCNHILMENNFEHLLIDGISESTRYRLMKKQGAYVKEIRKLPEGSKVPTESFQEQSSKIILSSLQTELEGAVTDIGRKLNRVTTAVKKMLLEITACLKKMNVDTTQMTPMTVDKSLRKDILSLKEVYGIGTIYDQIEIHVNSKSDVKQVEKEVTYLFRKKKVFCQFVVRALDSKPETFGDNQYEHGESIKCTDRRGTLGGFLEGSDNNLYGLTCAHVVKGPREENVFIQSGAGNQQVLLARSVSNMIVSTGSESKPLIDIAAVRVVETMKHRCVKFLKDDDGKIRPAILPADTPIQLVGHYVYKHGAKTQCTKGLVCSDDYSVLSTDELAYIILVDNYDDDDDDLFAKPGDSGSMICAPDEDFHVVKAVSVLSAGEFTPEDRETPLYFSFRLYDGLRKLTSQAGGVQFNFPQDYI